MTFAVDAQLNSSQWLHPLFFCPNVYEPIKDSFFPSVRYIPRLLLGESSRPWRSRMLSFPWALSPSRPRTPVCSPRRPGPEGGIVWHPNKCRECWAFFRYRTLWGTRTALGTRSLPETTTTTNHIYIFSSMQVYHLLIQNGDWFSVTRRRFLGGSADSSCQHNAECKKNYLHAAGSVQRLKLFLAKTENGLSQICSKWQTHYLCACTPEH